jgi:hypothetical protein
MRMEAVCSYMPLVVPISPHGITIQKTNIDVFAAFRISNITHF